MVGNWCGGRQAGVMGDMQGMRDTQGWETGEWWETGRCGGWWKQRMYFTVVVSLGRWKISK